jgi:hypothetical protein
MFVKLRDSNGATRSHQSQNAVALALLARTVGHKVMGSDGDCALRSAPPIASFHRIGRQPRVDLKGQSPLP